MSAAGEYDEDDSIYVEKGNFEQIPHALWMDGAVSPRAVVLYLALSKRGSRENRGVPKRSTLGKDMGVTSVRTVDAGLDELVKKGWLLITPRLRTDADQGQTSNHYRLLWTPIVDESDPRLVKHLEQTAEFDRLMSEKQAKNEEQKGKPRKGERSVRHTSWQPPAQDSAPPSPRNFPRPPRAENCAPPAQDSAPQEEESSSRRTSKNKRTTPDPSLRSESAASDEAQSDALTEQEQTTGRDEDGKPLRGKKLTALAQTVTKDWWDWIEREGHDKPAQSFIACRSVVKTALANGHEPKKIKNGLAKITGECRAVSGGSLTIAMGDKPDGSQGMRRGYDDVATWGKYDPDATVETPSEEELDALFGPDPTSDASTAAHG